MTPALTATVWLFVFVLFVCGCVPFAEEMCEHTLQFFLLERKDAALIRWAHAVNSRSKLMEALPGVCAYTHTHINQVVMCH